MIPKQLLNIVAVLGAAGAVAVVDKMVTNSGVYSTLPIYMPDIPIRTDGPNTAGMMEKWERKQRGNDGHRMAIIAC